MIRGTRRNVDRRRSGRYRAPSLPLLPIAATLIAAIGIGVFVVPRFFKRDAPPGEETSAVADRDETPARSTKGRRRPAPESRAARVVRENAAETPASAASSPSTTPSSAPATDQMYALEVGRYQSRDWADDERASVVSDTGLRGWLVRDVDGDGVETYRVIIGAYSSRERAEMSAETLLGRGVVSTARVIPLPPRKKRL